MNHQVIMTGFGGQGVMLMGQILAQAGMMEDRFVSWIPSYGAEMRGGSANCAVIVSDSKIGCPLVHTPDILLAMNLPSLRKFESKVRLGGVILYNSSLIDEAPQRDDVTIHAIPANDIAEELGNPRVANMVMLGAVVAAGDIVRETMLTEAFRYMFAKKVAAKPQLLEINAKAMHRGAASVEDFRNA